MRLVATPSTAGVWEIAAATRPSRAATSKTWPPANEVPHTTMRSASTTSSERACAIALA
jgi:hypothetical protein